MIKKILFLLIIVCNQSYSQSFSNLFSNKNYSSSIGDLKRFGFKNSFKYNKADIALYKDSIQILRKIKSATVIIDKQLDVNVVLSDLRKFPNLKYLKFKSSFFLREEIKQQIFPKKLTDLKNLKTIILYGNPGWNFDKLFLEFSKMENLKALKILGCPKNIFLNPNLLEIKNLEGIYYSGRLGPKIPEKIYQLKKLKTFILQVDEYPDVNLEFTKIKNLENLDIDLYNNKYNAISQIVSNFSSLKKLSISGKIYHSKQLFYKIAQNTHLKYLKLSNNNLTTIPSSIKKLKQLSYFFSSNNRLTQLPAEFYTLTQLKSLEIQGGRIKRISSKINKLHSLEELKIHFNGIKELPKKISGLGNLKILKAEYNSLSKLPDDIGRLRKLTNLSLSQNKLKELPKSITKLKNLDSLNLKANYISVLPKQLGSLKNMTYLNLSMNQLTQLPSSFTALKKLKHFDVSGNRLTSLPKNIGQLKALKRVNASSNYLTKLPSSFGYLESLERLELSHNNLQVLPITFGKLLNLKILYINNKPNHAFSFDIYIKGKFVKDSVYKRSYKKNNLINLPESFKKLKKINFIDFSYNENLNEKQVFNILKKSDFSDYSIDLAHCNLTKLPEKGWKKIKVKSLDLSDNFISKIPKNIMQARYLTYLSLSRNKGISTYRNSKAQLNLLYEELGFISKNQQPKTLEMAKAYVKTANSNGYGNNYSKVVEYAERAFAIDSTTTFKNLFEDNLIKALYKTQHYKKAIYFASSQIKKDTSYNVRFLNSILPNFTYMAKSQLALGDTIKAIKTYAIVSKKFSGNNWTEAGLLAKKIKQDSISKLYFEKSFTDYKKNIKSNPKNLGQQFSLLEAYIIAYKNKEALQLYKHLKNSNIKDKNYRTLLNYFHIILHVNTIDFKVAYRKLESNLKNNKYSLNNWSFELFMLWNQLNNYTKTNKEKINKLTALLSQ